MKKTCSDSFYFSAVVCTVTKPPYIQFWAGDFFSRFHTYISKGDIKCSTWIHWYFIQTIWFSHIFCNIIYNFYGFRYLVTFSVHRLFSDTKIIIGAVYGYVRAECTGRHRLRADFFKNSYRICWDLYSKLEESLHRATFGEFSQGAKIGVAAPITIIQKYYKNSTTFISLYMASITSCDITF